MNATAAARKTAAGTKVYIHTNCSCAKVNGKILKGLDTVAAAEQYAADNDMPHTLCKTSVTEQVTETTEQGAPEFTLTVDNTDQFGKQRRDAVAGLVEALGAEMVFSGIKNRHRTGNDAFAVQITKAPAALQGAVDAMLADIEAELEAVVGYAKAEGALAGWDSNTRQKHWKNTARGFIVRKGAQAKARVA
jgi:hypothetical protein